MYINIMRVKQSTTVTNCTPLISDKILNEPSAIKWKSAAVVIPSARAYHNYYSGRSLESPPPTPDSKIIIIIILQ